MKQNYHIYSRHTMEDIENPIFAINEMIRCCKSGYIEITKGIDAINNGKEKLYTGYRHHRNIIWSNIEKCEIYILPKYSTVIDHFIECDNVPNELYDNAFLWNNYNKI